MSADISVVICAHHEGRWRHLQACLRSLEQQRLKPCQVVVVVDHNRELFRRIHSELDVTVIENTQTRGLGGARNSGLAVCSGSIVAFLDDDAVASRQWLSTIARYYADADVAGVGGSIEPLWADARPAWFPEEFFWVVGCSYLGLPERPEQVRNLFGCNMSFRRELLVALGGFRLGYGCDETELCIRLQQRWPERKLLYVPHAKVLHHVPPSRTGVRRFVSRCYFEGGSKAVVSRLVGPGAALSSEYRYAQRILPKGVRRGIGDFIWRRERHGLGRAAAIAAGLASTTAGYAAASFSLTKAARERGWSGDGTLSVSWRAETTAGLPVLEREAA